MKRETLRVNNLNLTYTPIRKLKYISFYAFAGDIIGFLGLTNSGKDILILLLTGQIDMELEKCRIFIDGKKITTREELESFVYKLSNIEYDAAKDWTVAEYIGLYGSSWLQMKRHRRILLEEVGDYLKAFGITDIEASRKMRQLTEYEKRVVDIIRARKLNKKIMIIEDEFEGMHTAEIKKFYGVLKRISADQMAVIINSNSDAVLKYLADRYIIFQKGEIVKKCRKEYIKNSSDLWKYLLTESTEKRKRNLDGYEKSTLNQKEQIYRICNLNMGDHQSITFYKGEVTSLLILDREEKSEIFAGLSGRGGVGQVFFYEGSEARQLVDFSAFTGHRIVSVLHLGGRDEIFSSMSAEENMLLPSLWKVGSMEYLTNSGKVKRMVRHELRNIISGVGCETGELGINDIITLTLERWYLYKPSVLVLMEPFAQCDIYGISIVKSYIKKFVSKGTSVIIIKSRTEYIEDISDRIIRF